MDKEHELIPFLEDDSPKKFIEDGKTVDIGSFENFLNEPLKKIIEENPECFDLPIVVSSEIERFSSYPGVLKTEFSGSMARIALGFGTMETYYKGKNGIEKLLPNFTDTDDEEVEFIKNIVTNMSQSSLDMDFCFRFKGKKDLFDLYDSAVKDHRTLPGFSEIEETPKIKEFTALLGGKYNMCTRLEPIPMRPGLMKMTMHISIKNNGEEKELLHLDLTLFPKDGDQAESQGRSGGRTLRSQDKGRMEMRNIDGNFHLMKTPEGVSALYGQEDVDMEGKEISTIVELLMRASRIVQIDCPKRLSIDIRSVNSLFSPDKMFIIREKLEDYLLGFGKRYSQKDFKAAIGDLVLSFNYDPFITLQYLQDTGLYNFFPGIADLTGSDWKKLYLNKYLNLSPETDGHFIDPEKRSLTGITKDQKEYKERGLENGFILVLKALHDIKHKGYDFDFNKAIKEFFFGGKDFDKEKIARMGTLEAIVNILKYFEGGLTEKGINRIFNNIKGENMKQAEFRCEFRKLKNYGAINKQTRVINDKGREKGITFYTLSEKRQTEIENITYLLVNEWQKNEKHPYLNTAKTYLEKNGFVDDKRLMEDVVWIVTNSGVRSLEALRSYSIRDFDDIYEDAKPEKLNKDKFEILARALQIISEDILRYPKFGKRIKKS